MSTNKNISLEDAKVQEDPYEEPAISSQELIRGIRIVHEAIRRGQFRQYFGQSRLMNYTKVIRGEVFQYWDIQATNGNGILVIGNNTDIIGTSSASNHRYIFNLEYNPAVDLHQYSCRPSFGSNLKSASNWFSLKFLTDETIEHSSNVNYKAVTAILQLYKDIHDSAIDFQFKVYMDNFIRYYKYRKNIFDELGKDYSI